MLKLTPRAIEAAHCGLKRPRSSAATRAIGFLKCSKVLILVNSELQFGLANLRGDSIGSKMLTALKLKGTLLESEVSFTQSALHAYRPILQHHLKWITVIKVGDERTLVWCGPDSACWSDVVKIHSSRRPHRPK